jgi:hypothetical protein
MTESTPPADMPPAPMAPAPAPMAPPPMAPMAPAPGQMAAAGVRPMGATVISIIEGIIGVLALLAGLLFMIGMSVVGGLANSNANAQGLGGVFAGVGIVFGVIIILIGVLYLAIAYGVWKGRSWSWMLGMIVSIIAIVFGVLGLSGGVSLTSIISLALPIVVVYFLWQPEVKRWLGRPV